MASALLQVSKVASWRTACLRLNLPVNSLRTLTTSDLLAGQKKMDDPVKQIFLDKLSEYQVKSKGGQLPDLTPEFKVRHANELERVKKQYGGGDLEKFPEFNFKD